MSDYVAGISQAQVGAIHHLMFAPFTSEIIGTIGNILSSIFNLQAMKGIITWHHNPFTPLTTLHASNDVIEALAYSKFGIYL